MGYVQQAVLEFDEEILAPWRPRLVAVAGEGEGAPARPMRPHPSGRSSSRVGVCRPPEPPARSGAVGVPLRVRTTGTPARAANRPASGDAGRGRPRGRRAGARVRLTRRARVLGGALVLTLGVAIGSWLGPLLAGSDGDLRMAGVQSVVVQPGDTLWSIAAEAAGTDDVREVVDRIQALNGLSGTVLIPGQILELP
jgi:hypothetical protein